MNELLDKLSIVLLDVYKAEATAEAAGKRLESIQGPAEADDIQNISMLTDITREILSKIETALQTIQVQAAGGQS